MRKPTKLTKLLNIRVVAALIMAVILQSNLAKAQGTNFSGTWARNTAKTDPGGLSINSVPVSLAVSQTADQISIKRTSIHADGDTIAYTEQLKFDGTKARSSLNQNVKKEGTMQWGAGQKTFTEASTYTDEQGNVTQKLKETWELSGDGRSLTITGVLEGGGNTYNMVEIFDKQ